MGLQSHGQFDKNGSAWSHRKRIYPFTGKFGEIVVFIQQVLYKNIHFQREFGKLITQIKGHQVHGLRFRVKDLTLIFKGLSEITVENPDIKPERSLVCCTELYHGMRRQGFVIFIVLVCCGTGNIYPVS